MTSTVTRSVSAGLGGATAAPLPEIATCARPATPALSFTLEMRPTWLSYSKPADPLGFQHGLVPQVPPGAITASKSGCGLREPSYMQSAYSALPLTGSANAA